LHFFLPVAERSDRLAPAREGGGAIALPILTVPVAGRDVVRAAFAWNLTVELARLGARAVMVAPRDPATAPLWPEPGRGPLGAQVSYPAARDLVGLGHAA